MELPTRPFQVIVFGASGYTGVYVVQEFLKYPHIKLAVAGRNEAKLKNMITDLSGDADVKSKIGIVIADVNDKKSLITMCKSAEILISCVGPYRFFGHQVVEACVESETHYLDVSGEPQFLEQMQVQFFEAAKAKKLYIVGACGLDSIPCDIGIEVMKQNFPGLLYSVETYLELHSEDGMSGNFATWQSAIYGIAHASELKDIRRKLNNLLFKDYKSQDKEMSFSIKKKKKPVLFKEDGKWCIPFVGSDKSVCMRTQRFNNVFDKEFPVEVNTFMTMPSLFKALAALFLGFIFFVLAGFKFGRYLLENYPEFFSGGVFKKNPEPEEKSRRSISMTFKGRGWDIKGTQPHKEINSEPNTTFTGFFNAPVGPYKTTAICIVACVKTILDERNSPSMKHFGVLTPGSAFHKTKLVEHLKTEGITYK